MTSLFQSPELQRLRDEAVRIVKIPESRGFARDDGRLNLANVVKIGLNNGQHTKRQIVQSRLKGEGIGFWQCPRRQGGPKSEFIHALPRSTAYRFSGICEWPDNENKSGICGAKLQQQDNKWHEFAEAFGYLDSIGTTYGPGKFGSVSTYLINQVESASGKYYFDFDRADLGLKLWALLERHADMVLPVLWTLTQSLKTDTKWPETILDIFRANLGSKLSTVQRSNLSSSNRGVFELSEAIKGNIASFPVDENERPTQKTQLAHAPRTRTFLQDLGLISLAPKVKNEYRFTGIGNNLVSALKRDNILTTEQNTHLHPSFETIHDVFSSTPERYADYFNPQVSTEIFERMIVRTLIPESEYGPWETRRTEFEKLLPNVVQGVASAEGSARADTIRLALFVYLLGRGQPSILENDGTGTGSAWMPNQNAVSTIVVSDPKLYMVGNVRTSRRHWNVVLLRRNTGGI